MSPTTRISKVVDDDMLIRGKKQSELIEHASFSDSVFLLLAKRMPSKQESAIFNACLVACVDHGMGTASAQAARFVASTGTEVQVGVSAGILALGSYHGGSIEEAMLFFSRLLPKNNTVSKQELSLIAKQEVQKTILRHSILFGYGHKLFKEKDPRVVQLAKLCDKNGYCSAYIDLAFAVEDELLQQKGKRICLNIDGFFACILLAMGFSPKAGRAAFIVSRSAGLAAQVIEEIEDEKKIKRLDEDDITYEA